jgi:asparagine synthase (glutamine-hydrolysing)
MCGISAVLSLGCYPEKSCGEDQSSLKDQLSESLDLVQHRGPDARGQYASDDGKVCMEILLFKVKDLSDSDC